MLKKGLGIILGILVLILGAVCWMKLRTPEEGQKVEFEVGEGKKGEQAVNVSVIG